MRKLARVACVATFSVAAALAQGHMGPPNGTPGSGPGTATPPNPANMIQRRVAFLTTMLNLTPAQTTQATTIFTNAATAITPLQSNINTARQSLRDAIKTNNSSSIDNVSATIGNLTGQILAIQTKAEGAFYATLTPDQKAKYDQIGHAGFGPHGPGMGRMGGRRPGQ